MNPCIIGYMLLTYALKAVIFVWAFDWVISRVSKNFIVLILLFTIMFAALDFILVSILPASGWKKEVRERILVPENMQCVLSLDYLIKAGLFYYVYIPAMDSTISYYDSASTIMKFIIVFSIMFGVDVAISYLFELGVSKEYAEQFCSYVSI